MTLTQDDLLARGLLSPAEARDPAPASPPWRHAPAASVGLGLVALAALGLAIAAPYAARGQRVPDGLVALPTFVALAAGMAALAVARRHRGGLALLGRVLAALAVLPVAAFWAFVGVILAIWSPAGYFVVALALGLGALAIGLMVPPALPEGGH